MTVGEFYHILDTLYPRTLSCSWDNDGLMVCAEPDTPITAVAVALDATERSIAFAAEKGCQLLLTHHPLLFRPLKELHPGSLAGRRVLSALRGGVSVISLHTRLDAGNGGVNDALAAALGLAVLEKFGDANAPELGRISVLSEAADAEHFAEYVREALGCGAVVWSGTHPVRRVALVGGDGKDMIPAALAAGADTLLTGAASYNAALDAAESGLNLIEAGHYHTEAPVLDRLAALAREHTGAECFFYDSSLSRVSVRN